MPDTPTIQAIDLDCLIPTPDNPRWIDPASQAFRDLVASVAARGILQPLIARPHPTRDGFLDLRAGHRRLLAAREAGLASAPVIVLDLDDKAAAEVTVIENLHREDLTPLEEAAGVRVLTEAGFSLESIAAEIGKPTAWVARRAKLADLTPQWAQWAAAEQVSAAHLELIARLPAQAQDALFHDLTTDWNAPRLFHSAVSLTSLRAQLANHTHAIEMAPFDLRDVTLHPAAGACTACPKRSSCQPELFDPEDFGTAKRKAAKPDDRCLDAKCWDTKAKANLDRAIGAAEKSTPGILRVSESYSGKPGILSNYQYTRAAKGAKGAKPAIYVDGPKVGKIVQVIVKGHARKSAAAKPAGPKSLETKRAELELRRKALAIDHLRGEIGKCPVPSGYDLAAAARLAIVFGTDEKHDAADKRRWGHLAMMGKAGEGELTAALLNAVRPVLSKRLVIYQSSQAAHVWSDAVAIAAELRLDLAKLKREADGDIPTPKAWSKVVPAPAKPAKPAKARRKGQ